MPLFVPSQMPLARSSITDRTMSEDKPSRTVRLVAAPSFHFQKPWFVPISSEPSIDCRMLQTISAFSPSDRPMVMNLLGRSCVTPTPEVPTHKLPSRSSSNDRTGAPESLCEVPKEV